MTRIVIQRSSGHGGSSSRQQISHGSQGQQQGQGHVPQHPKPFEQETSSAETLKPTEDSSNVFSASSDDLPPSESFPASEAFPNQDASSSSSSANSPSRRKVSPELQNASLVGPSPAEESHFQDIRSDASRSTEDVQAAHHDQDAGDSPASFVLGHAEFRRDETACLPLPSVSAEPSLSLDKLKLTVESGGEGSSSKKELQKDALGVPTELNSRESSILGHSSEGREGLTSAIDEVPLSLSKTRAGTSSLAGTSSSSSSAPLRPIKNLKKSVFAASQKTTSPPDSMSPSPRARGESDGYNSADEHGGYRDSPCYDEKERDHFSQFVTENFTGYCKRKRRDKIYGNNLEIQAMAEMYNRPIHIFSYSSEPINTFQGSYQTDLPPILLSYHRGNHYNSLVDPLQPVVGAGLGFGSLRGKIGNGEMVKAAIKAQQDQQIEKALMAEGQFYSDLELTERQLAQSAMETSFREFIRQNQTGPFVEKLEETSSSASAHPSSSRAGFSPKTSLSFSQTNSSC